MLAYALAEGEQWAPSQPRSGRGGATLERKKWTVEISGVSTFLTLPVREKSGQLRFQNFLSPLFVGVFVGAKTAWVGGWVTFFRLII